MPFERFDSVFDALALTLAESAGIQVRFELLSALEVRILSWGVSQQAAALRLGIGSARLYDLMHGQLKKFSLAALVDLTATAARVPVLKVEKAGTV
ncbi:MAG: XRE family transcriptional regulator [Pseudomonadota bacterium]|nr:XRE family transcriptional regulator [Pseudomonadota bacterium]